MNEEEKKIKIEELPDEGGPSLPQPILKRKKPQSVEPRINNLKGLNESAKMEEMSKKWYFDKKRSNLGMAIGFVVLGLLDFLSPYQNYISPIQMGMISSTFETLVRHPLLFSLTFPYFFLSSRKKKEGFTVTFDGIQTVKKKLPPSSKEDLVHVFIKWDEMTRLEKDYVEDKEILKIFSIDGHIGDIIWYIEIHKKRAVLRLLNTMLIKTHPMLVFLENEKELK